MIPCLPCFLSYVWSTSQDYFKQLLGILLSNFTLDDEGLSLLAHLAFTDDLIACCGGNYETVNLLLRTTATFTASFGLAANSGKTHTSSAP